MNHDPLFEYFIKNRASLSQNLFKERALFKRYGRFPQIALPSPRPITVGFSQLVLQRESSRVYAPRALSLHAVSDFFYWSAGRLEKQNDAIGTKEQRVHPSGGGKYPIEFYVLVLRDGDIERGVYHYRVETHVLERLISVDIDTILRRLAPHDDFAREAGAVVLFSFVKNRSFGKYSDLAYKLAFIEAEHVGQNMYLVASALGLACCGMGTNDGTIYDAELGLDGIQESVFYGLALGNKIESVV